MVIRSKGWQPQLWAEPEKVNQISGLVLVSLAHTFYWVIWTWPIFAALLGMQSYILEFHKFLRVETILGSMSFS